MQMVFKTASMLYGNLHVGQATLLGLLKVTIYCIDITLFWSFSPLSHRSPCSAVIQPISPQIAATTRPCAGLILAMPGCCITPAVIHWIFVRIVGWPHVRIDERRVHGTEAHKRNVLAGALAGRQTRLQ